jgi:hypothetical protein
MPASPRNGEPRPYGIARSFGASTANLHPFERSLSLTAPEPATTGVSSRADEDATRSSGTDAPGGPHVTPATRALGGGLG